MTRFTSLAVPVVLALAAITTACDSDDEVADSTLLVVNDSDFVIEELFITDVNASGWGPNLLAPEVLLPGEEVLLFDIPCGIYDALLVDEAGVECELLGIELCFDDATWFITNDTCTVFAAQAEAAAPAQ